MSSSNSQKAPGLFELMREDAQVALVKTMDELYANLDENCIPREIVNMDVSDYHTFLEARRKLMAQKVKAYFNSL